MKKLLSLFTILCCIFSFASFPALAAETSAQVVTFSDNFETEDGVPDNWRLYGNSSGAELTVEEENGNKFLRLNPTQQCWSNEATAPIAITKEGKVNLPTNRGVVRVKMKFRVADITGANSMPTVRLAYPEETNGSIYTPTYANEYLLFVARDYGTEKDMFCYAGTSDNAVNSSGIALVNNTWYDVTAMMDYSAKKIYYIVGSRETGYKRFSSNINGSSLSNVEVIDNITVKLMQVNANNYTDIDDVSISYLPNAKNFYDNFETETDTTPDNWEVAQSSENTTVTVQSEENGNKYLRLQLNETLSGWNKKNPAAATKAGIVSMPLADKPVLVKYRARFDAHNGSAPEFHVRVAVPGGATAPEDTSNKYKLVEVRTAKDSNEVKTATLRYYTTNTYPSVCSKITFNPGEWYDIYALAEPLTSKVRYAVGNKDGEYVVFNDAKFEILGTASVDVIDNLYLSMLNSNKGLYMDLDDVYVGYYEDYTDYLPSVLSFEDTFENAAVDSVPANWIDRAGVSTIKVMEETGNKYVRVTKSANTTGVPQVSTKDGVINIPWNGEYGKGIIVEAKIRQQNANYRSLLMVNSPYLANDTELSGNYGTPFYIHTNMSAYFMPGYKAANAAVATLGEWLNYRAVIIPGETQTEIRHYFNNEQPIITYANASNMPELFNPESLYNIAFTWRPDSGNPSSAITTGYMDFDDIKVYEVKAPIYEVKVTNAQGTEIENIENGTITVDAKVVNNGTGRTVDVIGALYTKVGDSWKLTETKKVINPDENDYLYAFAWRTGTGTLSLNVTDAANQMIKVFVWNRTADLDDDASAFETSLRAIPVCEPIVID
ncbi:MAG: hypothetical protein IKA17_07140 [Clostridia bacterium]|nr:hypothetical protein [Clostridia bacterium]